MKSLICLILLLLLLVACDDRALVNECVLSEGMKITAFTPSGKIKIEGGKGLSRSYSGDGWSITTTLLPRPTRWYGSLGAYDPADGPSIYGRLIVDEGRQFFSSESEALRYLQAMSGYFKKLTYNN